ncbi:helix-turn-helix domain-containing protein [Chloroflexi bacterium CFX3]|nr:helix-turn-helix domain-containing protein [Chloroflexi bacterium CFX3]
MNSRRKFETIERQYERPMTVILKELYAKHGSQVEVARALGVSQGTVSIWLMRLGLQQWAIIVPREKQRV